MHISRSKNHGRVSYVTWAMELLCSTFAVLLAESVLFALPMVTDGPSVFRSWNNNKPLMIIVI